MKWLTGMLIGAACLLHVNMVAAAVRTDHEIAIYDSEKYQIARVFVCQNRRDVRNLYMMARRGEDSYKIFWTMQQALKQKRCSLVERALHRNGVFYCSTHWHINCAGLKIIHQGKRWYGAIWP